MGKHSHFRPSWESATPSLLATYSECTPQSFRLASPQSGLNCERLPCFYRKFLLIFVAIFIVGSSARAETLKREVINGRKIAFPLRQVCKSFGKKHQLLAQALNTRQVDCMGEAVSSFDFCGKQSFSSGSFLRGYVEKSGRRVICESGEAVHLDLACHGRYRSWCKKPKHSCERLKSSHARRLELFHVSLVDAANGQNLRCYYMSSSQNDLFLTSL